MNDFFTTTFPNRVKLFAAKTIKLPSSLGYPDKLQIEPTNYCNARCPLCPTGASQLTRTKGFMDMNLYKKIIDEVSGKTSHITLWNYGEPFLHTEIFGMIDYTKRKELGISVSTNGYVFYTDEGIKKLAESDLDSLIVSLDGATKEIFSFYRKNVDFAKVIDGLKKLRKLKKKLKKDTPRVDIQFIVMKHNIQELNKMKKLAMQLGDSLRLKTVNVQMVAGIKYIDWLPDNPLFSRYAQDLNGKFVPKKQNYHNCPLIWYSLVINWDGTVNPCCYDYQGEVKIGDASIQSIHDIWTSEKMRLFRASIIQDRRQNKICRSCPVDLYREKLIILPRSAI